MLPGEPLPIGWPLILRTGVTQGSVKYRTIYGTLEL